MKNVSPGQPLPSPGTQTSKLVTQMVPNDFNMKHFAKFAHVNNAIIMLSTKIKSDDIEIIKFIRKDEKDNSIKTIALLILDDFLGPTLVDDIYKEDFDILQDIYVQIRNSRYTKAEFSKNEMIAMNEIYSKLNKKNKFK